MKNQTLDKDTPVANPRVYFSMLEKVGVLGRYQYLLMFFIFIVGALSSSCFIVNPYLFYEQEFQCDRTIQRCKEHVCSLPANLRAQYTPSPDGRLSLANQFGDFRCEGSEYVTLLNSSIILGSIIGIFSAIFFTEWMGRRYTMVFSLILGIIGLIIILFSNQTAAVVGVFIYGAGLNISFSCCYTFITEIFSEQHRGYFYNLVSLSFAVGIFINPSSFYLIYDWKWVVIFIFILPILIAALGFMFIVEDTPIELIAYRTYQEIYHAFIRIAKWNGVDSHGLTLQGVKEIKQEYDDNQRKKHAKVFSIVDLVRYKSLRSHLVPLGVLKFLMMFIYFAPGLLLNQFYLNIYINGLVDALSQLCGIPIQGYLLRFQRKFNCYLLLICSAIFAVSMYLNEEITHHSPTGNLIQSILLFFYRISCKIASFIVVVMINEAYPAQVRNLAIFFNNSMGRSSTLLVPFVISFCNATHIPFLILLALCSLIGAGSTCFTTQTFGIPPPEIIEEVRITEHHYKHYHIDEQKQKQ